MPVLGGGGIGRGALSRAIKLPKILSNQDEVPGVPTATGQPLF